MFWFLSLFFMIFRVWAAPTGFSLESGQAHPPVETSSGQFVVESSSNAYIHWDAFSIAAQETVSFQQASPENYVLNQVTGPSASEILGSLQSNGSVYLINPNGILIGPDAHIQTAGFIASTLDLCKEGLAQGALRFSGESDQAIVHQGKIFSSGEVFLIARRIDNRGDIEASRVGLLDGLDLVVQKEGSRQILIRPEEGAQIDFPLVRENPYAFAIRHRGHIEAKEVRVLSGSIEIQGTIDASGESGSIEIRGEDVVIGRGAILSADAEKRGDGGKVLVLGSRKTDFQGKISARGGDLDGHGGFAEVSAPQLIYRGLADLRAPNGSFGTLLLDPADVTISSDATTAGVNLATDPATLPVDDAVTINTTDLATQLGLSNVTIDTAEGGGAGPNGGSITVSNTVSWSADTTLSLIADSFISIGAAISNTYASASAVPAMAFTAKGVDAAANNGISLTAALTTNTKSVYLIGNASNATTAGHGVSITGSGGVTTTSGTINVAGVVPSGPTSTSVGVLLNKSDPLRSTSGAINICGTSAASGINSHGVSIASLCRTGTSGTVTLGTSITDPNTGQVITGCQGTTGLGSSGIRQTSILSATGNISATNSIIGRGVGYLCSAQLASFAGSISITASSIGTTSVCHGISIEGPTEATSGANSITLNGSGGAGTSSSHGINLSGISAKVSTGSGDIFLTGSAQGSATSHGIGVSQANSITSSSGNITLTGTTTASGSNSAGVSVSAGQNTSTTSSLTFLNCAGSANASTSDAVRLSSGLTHAGNLFFTDCLGGNNGSVGGHGVKILVSALNIVGNITATGIQGQGNGGKGFSSTANISVSGASRSISITASATGTVGACHGIDLTAGTMSTSGGGSITLNGTGGASSTASYGVNLSGGSAPRVSTATGNGNISLTGAAQGSAVSHGIQWNLANSITSTSGDISLTGTTTASGNSSFGVNVATAQDTVTSGTLTFLNCAGSANSTGSHAVQIAAALTHDGPLAFTTCQGGANGTTGGNGVNVTASPTLAGNVTGTGIEGRGAGGIGFFSSANFGTSGTLSLTASSSGTSGACHGISLGSNAVISTSGSSALTLSGTGGASNTASYGINLTNGTVSSASGTISLTGAAQGSAVSHGIQVAVAAAVNSTSGNLNLTGTTTASGNSSFGVNVSSSWDTTTSGTLTFLNSAGSANSTGSHAVQIAAALTHDGPLVFTTCQGGANGTTGGNGVNVTSAPTLAGNVTGTGIEGRGAGGIGFFSSVNFSTSGAISLTASSSGTSGACYGISMASGQTMSTTGGGTLSLNGTGGASDTASYGINLADWTISTATGGGNVSLTGAGRGTAVSHGVFLDSTGTISTGTGDIAITGSTTASGVGSFPVFLEMDLVTEGGSVSVQGAMLLAASSLVDTTNGGAAATGGNITFSNNIEGSSSNAQSLTLRGGTAGNILLSSSIGNSVALQNLIFTSGDDITVSSTVDAAAITQSAGAGLTLFSDNVTLTGAASLTGTQFTLNGTWITGGAVTIVNSGLLTMGTSSDFQLSGAFAQTGAGAVSLGGDVTTTNDAIGFAGPVTLTAGIDLDTQGAAGITFENTVTGAFSLSCTAGSATFEGVVGSTPLTSLVVTADAISVHASQSVSTGALTYTGPVTLFGNATFTKTGSGAVTFSEGIEGNFNAAIEAGLATVSIADAVDLTGSAGSGANGGSFTIHGGGNVTLGSQLLTHGATAAGTGGDGGSVEITSETGNISVYNIYTFGGDGATDGTGGDITLSPASTYTGNYPDGLIILNADLGAEGNLVTSKSPSTGGGGTITLDAGRSSYPKVATITSSLAGNDLTIFGETITMGSNEALTALGNLTMEATTMTLSDLVALIDMTITAMDINLLQHGDVSLLQSNGTFAISPSLHWQCGGTYARFGFLNPPGGTVDEGSLLLSEATFLPLLTSEDHILNYDGDVYVVPSSDVASSPISEAEKQKLIYQLSIADAELSDMLPPLPMDIPKFTRFKRKKN